MNAPERIEGRRLKTKSTAEPLETRELDVHARKAKHGSKRLRAALWKLQGRKPASIVKPRITKVTLCPACQGPIAPRMLIAEIQQAVAAFYGFPRNHLLGRRVTRDVSTARQIAMYLSCELTAHSVAEVGRRFNRDHTTVLHALKALPKRAELDEELAINIALLRERLGA